MKMIDLGGSGLSVSAVALGCMRIRELDVAKLERLVGAALDAGINFFDHADIYGGGRCEEKFGAYLARHPSARDDIILQTKCGIIIGKRYDFSRKHILSCVEGSLKRLRTDRIDVLLLHRPDALCRPEEVAETLDELHSSGKVRYFGVSNHNSMQMELLAKYMRAPIVFDQLRFGPAHTCMIDAGINVNMKNAPAVMRDGILPPQRHNDSAVVALPRALRHVFARTVPYPLAPRHTRDRGKVRHIRLCGGARVDTASSRTNAARHRLDRSVARQIRSGRGGNGNNARGVVRSIPRGRA